MPQQLLGDIDLHRLRRQVAARDGCHNQKQFWS
jgi:hypothetical protein